MKTETEHAIETKRDTRETKLFWAVDGSSVVQVLGYSCAPTNPTMWWCPKVGFSGSEGHSLFKTESQALTKAIAEHVETIRLTTDALSELQKRLSSK